MDAKEYAALLARLPEIRGDLSRGMSLSVATEFSLLDAIDYLRGRVDELEQSWLSRGPGDLFPPKGWRP